MIDTYNFLVWDQLLIFEIIAAFIYHSYKAMEDVNAMFQLNHLLMFSMKL